ncbi:hypothetical protein QQ983_14660 [Leptospira borgpetersenii]|nr:MULTISPECIES: hypothetical protein [Leptospira]MDQ7245580.1 hypothetical protein [Leptospira borgpetersenii]PTM49804.1 hypothetical protein CLV95_102223 [Leptospira borgpetersenii serovar Javanica]
MEPFFQLGLGIGLNIIKIYYEKRTFFYMLEMPKNQFSIRFFFMKMVDRISFVSLNFFNNSIENGNPDSNGFRLEMISNFTYKEFSKDLPKKLRVVTDNSGLRIELSFRLIKLT